jgi:hypothetical protein
VKTKIQTSGWLVDIGINSTYILYKQNYSPSNTVVHSTKIIENVFNFLILPVVADDLRKIATKNPEHICQVKTKIQTSS